MIFSLAYFTAISNVDHLPLPDYQSFTQILLTKKPCSFASGMFSSDRDTVLGAETTR